MNAFGGWLGSSRPSILLGARELPVLTATVSGSSPTAACASASCGPVSFLESVSFLALPPPPSVAATPRRISCDQFSSSPCPSHFGASPTTHRPSFAWPTPFGFSRRTTSNPAARAILTPFFLSNKGAASSRRNHFHAGRESSPPRRTSP